jgi:formate/nitrite transporter FocA (FNT family)
MDPSPAAASAAGPKPVGFPGGLSNLLSVTMGDLIGGTLLVAFVNWFMYLQGEGKRREARGQAAK